MADATVNQSASQPALLAGPEAKKPPSSSQLVEVAREFNVSPVRQMREMFALSRGRGRVHLQEYYSQRLFDPALSMEKKRQFVGEKGSKKLNDRLSPLKGTPIRTFLRDKVMYSNLITQLGFRSTVTQAVAIAGRGFGAIPTLPDAAAVEAFLRNDARFPLFSKPVEGSGSIGSALILGVESDMLKLGNGREVAIAELGREIFELFPDGFLFQDAVTQHEMLTRIAGPAIGSIRVVTLRDKAAPSLLYALWKIPSPSAMSDNFWQDGSMLAPVDTDIGTLGLCRIGAGLKMQESETHPVSGEQITGETLPFWDDIRDTACKAHELFPEVGVLGFDIALTPEGPLIIEANCNPHHSLYSLATGQGIYNADFAPRLEAAMTRSKEMHKATFKLALEREKRRLGLKL